MLDLFSNVFGKSKKSTNGKSSNDRDETSSLDKSNNNLYPTIVLTDQMLKGDSSLPSFEIVESSNRTPFKTNDSVIVSSNNRQKTFSPLDNVPFAINASNASSESVENSLSDLHDCFNILNSIASYLANPTSEYKFTMEKAMIMNHFDLNDLSISDDTFQIG